MNEKELLQAYIDAGWTRQEARLYTLLLELGPQPASVLASQLGKNRITIYHALERMFNKGWLSKSKAPYGWRYAALDPSSILHSLEAKRDEQLKALTRDTELFRDLVPHLEAIKGAQFKKPIVDVFYGDTALQQMYKLSLESSQMFAYYEPWDPAKHKDLLEADDWHTEQRIKARIPVKIILPNTKYAKHFAEIKKPLKEAVTVPVKSFAVKDITIITDDKLLMYSLIDKIGIAITSQQIAYNQQQQFLLAWEQAKKVGKYFG